MKILNLYCGIGGNRKLWGDSHDITAVELDKNIAAIYQEFYPNDNVICDDAHKYLLEHYKEYEFIWSSPPCPTHSRLCSALKGNGIVRYPDMKLYEEILLLKHFYNGKWVVENVTSYYDPLIVPQKLDRHYFWSNFNISYKNIKNKTYGFIGSNINEVNEYQKVLNINMSGHKLKNKRQILRNCVWPETGKHILDCAIGSIPTEKQLQLFG